VTNRAGAGLDPDIGPDEGRFRFFPVPKPPANMTIKVSPPPPAFPITITVTLRLLKAPGSQNQPTTFRLYYVNAAEYRLDSGTPGPITPAVLASVRHYVTQISMSNQEQSFDIAAAPFVSGGWLYALAVGADGTEGFGTFFVTLPFFFSQGIPQDEITSPNHTPTSPFTGPDGLRYREIPVSWITSSQNPATVGAKYIQIYVQNYDDNGDLWEGPVFNNPNQASKVGHGKFVLECDDGTGGFPNPGPHNVTLYFVSVGPDGQRRPDPLSAPSSVIVGGIG